MLDPPAPILAAAGAGVYVALRFFGIRQRVARIRRDVIAEIVRILTNSPKTRRVLRPLGIDWLLYYRRHRYLVRVTEGYREDRNTAALLDKVRGMNLSFTVTAGRSGTFFLHKLCSLLPDTTSLHEPDPAFHAHLRRIKSDPAFAKEFLLHYKLPWISNLPTRNYVELSHVFCKGFLEPLLELGVVPNLIVLRRDPRLIALSFFERDTVPERTFYGIEYLLSPRYPGTLPLPGWRRMTDYQLIFWYALEIERRQREYSRLMQAAGGVVCDMTATELDDPQHFVELAKAQRLLSPAVDLDALLREHAAIAKLSWNKNERPGRSFKRDFDIHAEEEAIWQAVSPSEPQLRSWVEQRYRTTGTAVAPALSSG